MHIASLLAVVFLTLISHASSTEDNYGDIDHANFQHPNATIVVGDQQIQLDKYLDSTELRKLMGELEKKYGSILKVEQIGRSALGVPILAAQISSSVRENKRPLMKPMFKYVANINGNDAVGYAMMVSLIQYLIYKFNVDDRIKQMLIDIDIWIIPNFNPDGFEESREGDCDSPAKPNGRNYFLDDDFPNLCRQMDKESETLSMMKFIHGNHFVLSGNFQGGANVVSYPFDLVPNTEVREPFSSANGGPGLASSACTKKTPDDGIFKKLAWDYAQQNSMMGRKCSENIPCGIRNGNQWNVKNGSMQDYNYLYSNCFELTFYLGCCKYPLAKFLPIYWEANLKPMLSFIDSTRLGVYGVVRNDHNYPVKKAVVLWEVAGAYKQVQVTSRGEYWRLLVPSEQPYKITVMAPGYQNVTTYVHVPVNDPYVQMDFVLRKIRFKKIKAQLFIPCVHCGSFNFSGED